MSKHRLPGLKEPKNLTGQATVDMDEAEFRGNYSCVYLGKYKNEAVAVKIIQRTGDPESMRRKLKRERMVWATMDHPNILPFHGFADDDAFSPFGALISPWCKKGAANRYMMERGEKLPFNHRISLWQAVIQGVVYLHEHQPIIIHGDLKPGNALVDEFGTPRICDFGLAHIFLEEGHTDMTTTSEHTGTARYLAPEIVASSQTVYPTIASDVYALGCLGLEFIYLQKRYSNRLNNMRGQIHVDLRMGLPPMIEKPRGEWPSHQAWCLITQMWSIDPLLRPSAFIAGRILDRVPFNFPLPVIQRIFFFAATIFGPKDAEVDALEWKSRCNLLRALCLVSRACKECTLPYLYGKIRLYLLSDGSSLSGLITALNNSKDREGPSNSGVNGYGRHAKTFILVFSSFRLNPWRGVSSDNIRCLLQLMPRLRCIVLSTLIMFPFTTVTRAMSKLEIRGSHAPIVLEQECTLELLSVVQQLSLVGGEPLLYVSATPTFEPKVYPAMAFPNLQCIDMQDDRKLLYDWANTLDRMSAWVLPRLVSLHVKLSHGHVVDDSVNVNREIKAFLGIHGQAIQYLTLIAPLFAHDWRLPWVLPKCLNLRSIVINTRIPTFPENLPSHLNLETLVIWAQAQDSDSADTTRCLSQVEKFRRLSTTLLPKLDKAEFKWGVVRGDESTTQVAASFKAGIDGCIVNGVLQYLPPRHVMDTSMDHPHPYPWITPNLERHIHIHMDRIPEYPHIHGYYPWVGWISMDIHIRESMDASDS